MELRSKLLEQIVFNTRSKIDENMLILMDMSIQEVNLDQPLRTNIQHFKIAVTFSTSYIGIFIAKYKNKKLNFHFSIGRY